MTEFARSEQSLPGLEQPRPEASRLELAAHQTIAALDEAGLLEPRHALSCQLILDLAAAAAAASRKGQAAATAMAAAQLRETFLTLPEPAIGGGEDDPFQQLVEELRAAALRDGPESVPSE